MFKILHGAAHLNDCVCLSYLCTRGNSCKMLKFRARLDIRKYFFAHRCINWWDNIPADIIQSNSINNIVSKLSDIDYSHFIEGWACE